MSSQRFDRLPATDAALSRDRVLSWWADRFGVPPAVFDAYTFWERGSGKVWIARGDAPDPLTAEGLGMLALRTDDEYWKPTTNVVQRFGHHADRNVIELSPAQTRRFVAGEDQSVPWDGDWGYLIAATVIDETCVPLGVGLYVYGELRSMVPKGRRRDLSVESLSSG